MPLALLGWLLGAAPGMEPRPGLRIVTHELYPAARHETVQYLLDDRARVEFRHDRDHRAASITRCDRGRLIVLNYGDRTFVSSPLGVRSTAARTVLGWLARARREPSTAPNLLIETTTVQTGERKTAFGFAARRVITTERRISLDVNAGAGSETEIDGWYIDLETQPACERLDGGRAVAVGIVVSAGAPRPAIPVVTFRDIGPPERGFAIETKTTMRSEGHTVVSHKIVRELAHEPLDPALFEIPPGFRDAEGLLARLSARLMRAWYTITSP
jgi:hypothetical protein